LHGVIEAGRGTLPEGVFTGSHATSGKKKKNQSKPTLKDLTDRRKRSHGGRLDNDPGSFSRKSIRGLRVREKDLLWKE